jgi:hypothetical protein
MLFLRGHVNAADGFGQVHKVIDAASRVLLRCLGEERGAHARTAIGCSTLPNGNAVTLEGVALLRFGPEEHETLDKSVAIPS